jgi:hypothetical protein
MSVLRCESSRHDFCYEVVKREEIDRCHTNYLIIDVSRLNRPCCSELCDSHLHNFLKSVAETHHYTGIEFKNINLDYNDLEILCSFLKSYKKIRNLWIRVFKRDETGLGMYPTQQPNLAMKYQNLFDAVCSNTMLQRLNLTDLELTSAPIDKLTSALSALSRLTMLDLSGNSFKDEDAFKISSSLLKSKTLKSFHFTDNDLSHEGADKCVKIWEANYFVTTLYLGCSHGLCNYTGYITLRNRRLDWNVIHSHILGLFLALAGKQLPVYIMLWIMDWLDPMAINAEHFHFKKVRLLEGLVESHRRVINKRQ